MRGKFETVLNGIAVLLLYIVIMVTVGLAALIGGKLAELVMGVC